MSSSSDSPRILRSEHCSDTLRLIVDSKIEAVGDCYYALRLLSSSQDVQSGDARSDQHFAQCTSGTLLTGSWLEDPFDQDTVPIRLPLLSRSLVRRVRALGHRSLQPAYSVHNIP